LVTLYLAELKRAAGSYAEASDLYTSACEIFLQNKLLLKAGYAQTRLAGAKLYLGDRDAARALCTETLALLGDRNTPWLAFQCYHLLGNLTSADRYAEAYQYFGKAIECIEHLCSNIQPDELKSSFLKDKLSVYEDMVLLCLGHDDEAKRQEAFSYVERAKSRSLIDLLARTYGVKAKGVTQGDQTIYQRWEQLRAELNWLYDRSLQNELEGKQRSVVIEQKLCEEIRVREKTLANLLRDLQLHDREYSSLQAVTTITVPELQEYLSEDEALLEYYFTGDVLRTFVISKDSCHVVTNPTRWGRINLLLQGLQFQLEKFLYGSTYVEAHFPSLRQGADDGLAHLYQALIEPVASLIEGKHLIVVPFNILHYVPFHALYDGSQYLIETREVSYAPSAGIFRLCQEKNYPVTNKALIMGVPGRTIPQIEEEVCVIRDLFPEGKLFVGAEATRKSLQDHAYDCNIIHLAAHGTFRYDNPLFSGFKLADSWLSFYDIYGLTLNANLVTLSGCHSGISQVAHGDELLGLMRGFLYAGAASLVASLWAADDRSTAEFMKLFYTKLKEGLPKRSALSLAQREIKKKYDHPYYWAPFTLVGKR
jgi:CHAT domain-containing protein